MKPEQEILQTFERPEIKEYFERFESKPSPIFVQGVNVEITQDEDKPFGLWSVNGKGQEEFPLQITYVPDSRGALRIINSYDPANPPELRINIPALRGRKSLSLSAMYSSLKLQDLKFTHLNVETQDSDVNLAGIDCAGLKVTYGSLDPEKKLQISSLEADSATVVLGRDSKMEFDQPDNAPTMSSVNITARRNSEVKIRGLKTNTLVVLAEQRAILNMTKVKSENCAIAADLCKIRVVGFDGTMMLKGQMAKVLLRRIKGVTIVTNIAGETVVNPGTKLNRSMKVIKGPMAGKVPNSHETEGELFIEPNVNSNESAQPDTEPDGVVVVVLGDLEVVYTPTKKVRS